MAEIPFVDTHFHLYDMKRPELRYSWLERDAIHGFLGNIDALKAQHYWIDDYIAEIRFSNVRKAVHVQAALGVSDPVNETKWLQTFADATGYPHGIVAECHLADPDAAEVLDRHSGYANVRGIRDFGDGRYLVDTAWRGGFRRLKRHNLVACIDTRIQHFDDLMDLATSFPDTMICVDHCAIPEARDEGYFKRWSTAVRALARAENILMKISGLGMMDRRWTIESATSMGARQHRSLWGGPGDLWQQLAGRPDVQLLSRPDQRLRENHLGFHDRGADRDVLAQRRKAVQDLMRGFGHSTLLGESDFEHFRDPPSSGGV